MTDWTQFSTTHPSQGWTPVDGGGGPPAATPVPAPATAPTTDWSQFSTTPPSQGWNPVQANVPEPEGSGYLKAGGKLLVRAPIEALTGLGDAVNLASYGIMKGAHWAAPSYVDEPTAAPSITDDVLQKLANAGFDIRMDKDAGMLMRGADVVAPFVAQELATGGVGGLVGAAARAPTIGAKVLATGGTAANLLARSGADAGLSYLGGNIGNQVAGPIGGLIGGALGGATRGLAKTGLIEGLKYQADPNAPAIARAGPEEQVTVTPEMVTRNQDISNFTRRIPFGIGNWLTSAGKSAGELEQAIHRTSQQISGDPNLPIGVQTHSQIGDPLQDVASQHLVASDRAAGAGIQRIADAARMTGATVDTAPVVADLMRRQQGVVDAEKAVIQQHINDLNGFADIQNPTNATIPAAQAAADRATLAEAERQRMLASNDPIEARYPSDPDTPVFIQPSNPQYAALKQQLYGTPITIPPVPPRGTRVRFQQANRVQTAMHESMEGQNTAEIAQARELLKGHIQNELNAAQPGLGDQYRIAQQEYANHLNTVAKTLEPITGKQEEGIFAPGRPAGAEVGGRTMRTLGMGGGARGDNMFAPEVSAALGTPSIAATPSIPAMAAVPNELPVSQAFGRAYANVGRTDTGPIRANTSDFATNRAARDIKGIGPAERALMERNTPGRSVEQQLANQQLLAEANSRGTAVSPSDGRLTTATTVGSMIPHVLSLILHRPIPAVMAGVLLRSVLKDPQTIERIARTRGMSDIIGNMARAAALGAGSAVRGAGY